MTAEADRLAELRTFRTVETLDSAVLKRATDMAAHLFQCPISSVTLVDEHTQWLLGRTGLAACSTDRKDSFCALAIDRSPRSVMVVEDAVLDPRFDDNVLVTGELGIRFYAGALLTTADGFNLGALCVLDTVPRKRPSDANLAHLQVLADLVVCELERARSERRRRQQQDTLKMAESMSGVGHWRVLLPSGEVTWSDEVYAIHGINRSNYDPAYDDAIAFYEPEDAKRLVAAIEESTAGKGSYQLEMTITRRNGVKRRVMAKGDCAFDIDGNPAQLYGVFQDVTVQRAAIVAAEQAAAVKSEFLANMSHELRTPLTSIVGFTDLAGEQPDLPPLVRDYIRRIDNAGRALLCTVNDILDFSKLEAGQVAIRPEPTDIEALCRSSLELFTPQAGAKDLVLELDLRTPMPLLLVDPDRIRQILLNLVGNAVKFTTAGSVVLSVDWQSRSRRLAVSITDTGAGIASDKLDRLFQRFSQIDGSTTRNTGGTGLGLAICKGLCEAMGGVVGAESTLGQGSRFWFEIDAEAAQQTGSVAPVSTSNATANFSGTTILVADDHPANRELARLFLSGLGAEVAEAVDGADAVTIAAGRRFDLILMDLRMPRLDGREALHEIRNANGINQATPILAYTADGDGDSSPLTDAGFAGVVSKPLVSTDFIRTVAATLAARPDTMLKAS